MRCLSAVLSLSLMCAVAAPALALTGFHPYVRVDQGGSGFRMTDVNSNILNQETALQMQGAYTYYQKVGAAWGPSASAGFWLLPFWRVGATYSSHHAVRDNAADDGLGTYSNDHLDFRVTEFGGETAFRIPKLAGFVVGGQYAWAKARSKERLESVTNYTSYYLVDGTAKKNRNTFGAFVGLEQTSEKGLVGFVHAGFSFRDMGHMPATWLQSDGTTTTTSSGETSWTDYSGYYVKLGVGFDVK